MLNHVKGDVPFKVGDESYTLRLGINSLIALESEVGLPMDAIEEELATAPRMTTIRALFWAGLLRHHPDITVEQAGDLIDAIGTAEVGALVVRARAASLPEPKKAEGATKPRPRKAATGTGSNG